MEDLKLKLSDIIVQIEGVTVCLYQQEVKKGYAKFNPVIASIAQAIDQLYQYKKENPEIDIEENRLLEKMTEALRAMEAGDTVLLADILQYELADYLKEIISSL